MISPEALKALLDGKVIQKKVPTNIIRNMKWVGGRYGRVQVNGDAYEGGVAVQNPAELMALLQDDWEPVPPQLMNWAEARAAMEGGKKVARERYRKYNKAFALRVKGNAIIRDEDVVWFPLGLDDLDATDWYVVE